MDKPLQTGAKRRRVKGQCPLRGLGQSPKQGYGGKTPIVPHREAIKEKAVRERSDT